MQNCSKYIENYCFKQKARRLQGALPPGPSLGAPALAMCVLLQIIRIALVSTLLLFSLTINVILLAKTYAYRYRANNVHVL